MHILEAQIGLTLSFPQGLPALPGAAKVERGKELMPLIRTSPASGPTFFPDSHPPWVVPRLTGSRQAEGWSVSTAPQLPAAQPHASNFMSLHLNFLTQIMG